MSKICKYLVAFMLVFALFMGACGGNTGNGGGNGGNGGDVYKDYEANKKPGGDQFDYDGNYSAPELTINGLGDDAAWQNITAPLATFGHGNAATVKIYRGEEALFFLFEVSDTILLTEGMSNDDSVTKSDSVEIYIDTLADGGNKPQNDDYQINLAIHGKTRIMQGSGSGWGNWNGLIDYEVSLNGTLNDGNDATDVGYTVEVMIPYKQINIERNDTIAIAFGHVDKMNNAGSTPGEHWDWFGWDYNGLREPQTPNNYLLLDKDNKLIDRDAEARPNADIAGYVTDAISGAPIAGATVTVTGASKEWVLTTDEQGYFLLSSLNPEQNYTVTVTMNGYMGNSVVYTRAELREVNGGRVLKDITIKDENHVEKTTLTGTVKSLLNGIVGGASVSVEGTLLTATADENGSFSIEGVPVENGKDVTLIVTANGYAESKNYVKFKNLIADGVTDLGEVNIHASYAIATGSDGFGNKSALFADSTLKVGRALTGIEFLLSGTRQLSGNIEVYLDTKESTGFRDEEASLWLFTLSGDGKIGGTHYAGGAFNVSALEYTVFFNGANGYEARFFVPYSYLGINPTEVFGISLGQWSTTAMDWDGWGFAGQFVAPEYSDQYIRVSATCQLYRQSDNVSMVDLSGNVGIAGVRVEAAGKATTTGNDGAWHFKVPATEEAVTITYTSLGYETKTTVLEAGYFTTHYSYRENVELNKQYATIRGIITDSSTGAPISGAMITVGGAAFAAYTNENGEYAIEGFWTKNTVDLIFSMANYATQTLTVRGADLAANLNYTHNVQLVSNNQVAYVTVSGTITNVAGPVAGASIWLEDEVVATTNANGVFTIENFKGVDSDLVVAKDGYMTQTLVFKASNLGNADSYTFEAIDMPKEYASLGELEEKTADKQAHFAKFSGYVTRTATAFEFKFVGARAFNNGQLEVYLDTGVVAPNKGATEVQLNLCADKSVVIVRGLTQGTFTVTYGGSDSNPEILLSLPYAALGINPTDIIGFYMGQWSTTAADWDPLTFEGAFLNADAIADHLRISADNVVYRYATNEKVVTLRGNAGLSGVVVKANGKSVVTAADGSYSMLIPVPNGDLTIEYSKTGYFTETTTVPAATFNSTSLFEDTVTMRVRTVSVSGTVADSVSGLELEGVKVSVKGSGISVLTGADGTYLLTGVSTSSNLVLVFELNDYATQEITIKASALAAADEHFANVNLVCTKVINNVELFGVVTNVNGPVAGASVSVEGYPDLKAVTNASGEFTIANVPVVEHSISIVKDGYIAASLSLAEDFADSDARDYNVGDIDLMLNYERMPGFIADKADTFAKWSGFVTRSAVGFEFKFTGERAFSGQIELFVDTKASAGDNARDTSDYLFLLKANGGLQIINWGEGDKNEVIPSNMKLTVVNADTLPEVYFTLPYSFFGQLDISKSVSATEVVGISVGQWSDAASDWDGWDCFSLIGASNTEFVKPEMPSDYIRIAADNTLYAKADNEAVDFSSYYFHFGTGSTTAPGAYGAGGLANAGLNADDFYGKVLSRDANGVTFEFISTGNFSINSITNEKEMILIYFDTGAVSNDGWNPDYLIKIASDGAVYGNNSAWWSANDGNKLSSTATITTANGVTKITYTVSYDVLGIAANDVFGVAMREASHNAGDHMLYDPWHDFYFAGETTGRDAAACTQFIRVASNGAVYADNNNNPND